MKRIKKIFVSTLACLTLVFSLFGFSSCTVLIMDSYEYNGATYVRNETTRMYHSDLDWNIDEDGRLVGQALDPTSFVGTAPIYVDKRDKGENVIHVNFSFGGCVFYVKENVDLSNAFDLELTSVRCGHKVSADLKSGFKLKDVISKDPVEKSELPQTLKCEELCYYLALCPSLYSYMNAYYGEERVFLKQYNDTEYYEVVDEGFKGVLMRLCYAEN